MSLEVGHAHHTGAPGEALGPVRRQMDGEEPGQGLHCGFLRENEWAERLYLVDWHLALGVIRASGQGPGV